MNCCKQCQEKQNKYRILQSDLEFEIKKMTQDLANEKVTLEMHFQKESKKVVDKYNKEKIEREEENRKWIQKYDQIVSQYEQKIQMLHKEYLKKQKEIESFMTTKYSKKQQQIKNTYVKTMQNLEKTHQLTVHNLEKKLQDQCLQAKYQKQQQIRKLTIKHQEDLSCMSGDYDAKIKQLKLEITLGLENIDKLKLESHQKQTLLYEELYLRKQEISTLKYNVDQLNANIKALEEEIRLKNLQIEVIKEQYEENVKQIQLSFENQKQSIVSMFSSQIENLLKGKLDDCCKFEQVVKDIEIKRENEIKLYETNMKEVKQFVEERPSREEDIQQISMLKELLNQKEKQFQKALNQAKGYRLELNNKQQIFNKIFCSHSPLNIQKVGKKKQSKIPRTNSSTMKDIYNKYQTVGTFHTLSTTTDLAKKEKLVLQPKSTKFF